MNPAPSVTPFAKGLEAPCVRFALSDGSHLVLPYIHASLFELRPGGKLLLCQFGETKLQIEGDRLLPLLIDLQRHAVDSIEPSAAAETGLVHVSRIVKVELPEELEEIPA
jgi:hypothetical protein